MGLKGDNEVKKARAMLMDPMLIKREPVRAQEAVRETARDRCVR